MNKQKQQKKENNKKLKAWKEAVKANWHNVCAVCGKTERLNCHHLLPYRLYKAYRYEEKNGILLCPGCHKYSKGSAHQDPIKFAIWLRKNYVFVYDWIEERN